MALQAFVEGTDQIVNRGDTVTDFRGDTSTFSMATRARTPGRSGKVTVAEGGEYYDGVFGLEVREV